MGKDKAKIIKSIVALVLSLVMCIVGAVFTTHVGLASGEGNGTSASVKNPEEAGEILGNLPPSSFYYQGAGGPDIMFSAADSDDLAGGEPAFSFRPLTLATTTDMVSESSTTNSSSGQNYSYRNRRSSSTEMHRKMDVYYTADAAYYWSRGTITGTSNYEYSRTEDGRQVEDKRTNVVTRTEFDIELYLFEGGAYVKYNKWNVTELRDEYDMNAVPKDDDDDEEDMLDKLPAMILEAI